MENKKAKQTIFYIIFGIVYFIGVLVLVVSDWMHKSLGTTFKQFLYTIMYPLDGSDNSTIIKGFKACTLPIVLLLLPYIVYVVLDCKGVFSKKIKCTIFKKYRRIDLRLLLRRIVALVTSFVLIFSLFLAAKSMQVGEYIKSITQKTTIYEERYIDPDSVQITAQGTPKNLVYIYIESMENAYADASNGGVQPTNLIPNLTNIAKENISFSNSDAALGGAYPITNTTWTMAALFALNSGLPFSFPATNEGLSVDGKLAKGTTTLGDILEKNGYVQEFMCGSDAIFGGRKSFFAGHGNYIISDYYTAIEQGDIASDYHVFWGHEDNILYKRAKKSLTKLAATGKPFNFTMLTVDTHFPDGYVCADCGTNHNVIAANVVECADRQIAEFMNWCKEQSWYENTVFVIVGDHPRMDTSLVDGLEYQSRTMYNVIINADAPEKYKTQNRIFTQMDMFPTVLSAMGFNIEGERLALGTNLFSQKQTLAEEMGYWQLHTELGKYSKFFVSEFS